MKFILSFLFLLSVAVKANAQSKTGMWSIGINPLSLAESQMSIGPAASYRLSDRLAVWSELSFIFANSYMPKHWKQMKGVRFILQPRYYLGEARSLFITPEFRLKTYSFDNTLTLINAAISDTLRAFPFRERQLLLGGALVLGKRYSLSRKKGLGLEITAGLGAKHRLIKRKNVPAGYSYDPYEKSKYALAPAYEEHNSGTVLFPLGLRLMWQLR